MASPLLPVTVLLLGAGLEPADRAVAFWKAHCAKSPAARKQGFIDHGTFAMMVKGLSQSLDPVEHMTETSACPAVKAVPRVVSKGASEVVVELSFTSKPLMRGFPPLEVHFEREGGEWRVAFTQWPDDLHASEGNQPKLGEHPADFAAGPEERAAGFLRRYVPASVELMPMARNRSDGVAAMLSHDLTRRLLISTLTAEPPYPETHPNDPLVCYPIGALSWEPYDRQVEVTVVSAKTAGKKATVTLRHSTPTVDALAETTLELVKEDAWRVDRVVCPAATKK
ncbi:MAG: hypothetical protein JNK82_13175 [Myxococcaceae bacterium]|nr:hypothetical protein [Myxococcaceae bacterium]